MSSPTASTVTVHTRQQPNVLSRLQALFPASPTTSTSPVPEPPRRPLPRSLKIRMVTWNMHDSLPHGDLTELLGRVPPYRAAELSESGFPQFPAEDQHPYHLIVIAGQECPSLLGIPMGFGAGFKLRESDRESSRQKDDGKDSSPHDALGWTGMIEDWLCHGARHTSIATPEIGAAELDERKGPYQLLVKCRLMGLYMAVYIHRDLRPLVKGSSRSVVTTGLIGGRVGNKGGVGISLNIDGTTLLFINAHLAAHEGKVNHRLANFTKIKAQLDVDDFLSPDDPRVMAEELTDKFDYSFLLGDLNFRLNISRLHADWLISRQDYAQALTFDQLRTLMLQGEFVGWNEAAINFAPTFKYDVRTSKQRRRGSKLDRWRTAGERAQRLTEVNEHGEDDGQDSDKDAEGGEAASLSSSAWNSTHSRHGTEGDDDDYFQPSPSSHAVSSLSSPGSRVSISVAAHKAKTKWMALVSPSSPHSPTKWLKTKHDSFVSRFPSSPSVTTAEEKRILHHRSLDTTMLQPSLKRLSSNKSKSSLPSDDDDDEGDDGKGLYDTSHKKRVPSWCDRVLWKTTVQPEPEEEELFDTPASRPRTRVGQLLANAFRLRRGSYSSFTSAASVAAPSPPTDSEVSFTDSSSPSSPEVEHAAPFSRFVEPQGRILRSKSNEIFDANRKPTATMSNNAAPGLQRSNSASHNPSTPPPLVRPRRATLVPETLPSVSQTQSRVVTPTRWRFLPSFLTSQSDAMLPMLPKPPGRGDVLCLNYDTLDDRGMRRLEGRSDHRPVLASYIVYI